MYDKNKISVVLGITGTLGPDPSFSDRLGEPNVVVTAHLQPTHKPILRKLKTDDREKKSIMFEAPDEHC